MTVRQRFVKIHLWLGLGSGIIVFIVAVTGCLYAFEEELQDLFDRESRFVNVPEAAAGTLKIGPAAAFAATREELGPGYAMFLIRFADPERTHQVWARDLEDPDGWIEAYVHPYSGELLGHFVYHDTFWSTIVHLHTSLLLPWEETGRTIVGVATIIFVVLLVTGLVLWFPANRKVFASKKGRRSRFGITWGISPKRLYYDLHSVAGFYVSWVAVFIALTGLIMSFSWMERGVYWLASGGEKVPAAAALTSTRPSAGEDAVSALDTIYADAVALYPEAYALRLHEPAGPEEAVAAYVYLDAGTYYRHVELLYDQYTGKQMLSQGFEDGNAGEQLLRMNYDIHTGAILGLPGRILAFLASLFVASLPVTGVVVWYPRWRRKRKPREEARIVVTGASTRPAGAAHLATGRSPAMEPARKKAVVPSS